MGFAFELGVLNIDDGWELLKKKAFPHSTVPDFGVEEKLLQKIGKEMVQKCGRLPLAISLLGGVLSNKKSVKEWELVNENINAYLYRGEGLEREKEIHGVLNLSYEDLPHYLKPCFLYMGQLREDRWINVGTLYRMWIAQGMISHENQGKKESLMDIAELYLSELASRCIVQVEVEDARPGQQYRTCKLHDVVRELCSSKGKKEDFGFQILDYQGGKFSTLLRESLSCFKTRHVVICFGREMEPEPECGEHDGDTSRNVLSLLVHNDIYGDTIKFPRTIVDFQKFKLLRVLVLWRFNFEGRKLPSGIDKLIHLRYLSLRRCELDELPSSISNLAYLNTLNLQDAWNVRVPNVLKKMFRLKHLFLPYYDMEKTGNYRLSLEEGLDELETLFGLDSSVHDLKFITTMKNLRCFAVVVRDNESLSTIINAITTSWKNLQFFSLAIVQGCQFTPVQEGLMNLKKLFICPSLHELSVEVQIGRLLGECGNEVITSKLVRLLLFECEIEDDPMEMLGKLPFLELLHLKKGSFVGREMKCHALGFPGLKFLVLRGLQNLREWRVEEGAMPLLSDILIDYCPHLEMVPDGLRFIATLQLLEISKMPELGKRVSNEGGEDFDKVRHVPSIVIIGD